MIVYSNQCLACTNRHRWREIQKFARENGLQLHERRLGYNPVWQTIAADLMAEHEVQVPLIEHKGKVIHFRDNLESLL